jgi:hypothetical protein
MSFRPTKEDFMRYLSRLYPAILMAAAALTVAAPVLAQTPSATTPPPAPTAPPMTPNTDLLGTSCGEFLAMLAVANPGPNPTDDRASQATRAQRDVYMLVIWANGYVTAKTHADLAKASLTRDWIVTNTAAIARTCKANPNLSFFEAAGKL